MLANTFLSASSNINTGLVTEVVNFVKQLMGLFGEFPLNIFLIGSLAAVGFGLFRKAKKAAR